MQEVFEKIIEKLEEKIVITWKHDYDGGRKDAFNEAIEIVKQEAEQYNNGWIPCSERLPDKEECLLNRAEFWITDKDGDTYQATFNRIKQCWFCSIDNTELNVIAWQPLPEPYQPKGE